MAIDPNVPYDDRPTPPNLVRASLLNLQGQINDFEPGFGGGSGGDNGGGIPDSLFVLVDSMPGADDFEKITNALIKAQSESKFVWFSPRVYMCRDAFFISNWSNFALIGNDALLWAMDSVPTARPPGQGRSFFEMRKCHEFRIMNLHIYGNRHGRTGILNGAVSNSSAHNWQLQGCTSGVFDGCMSRHSACDGWRVDAVDGERHDATKYPFGITWQSCQADKSGRNGMSIVCGFDMNVLQSTFSNSDGIPPLAGIDLEPNAANSANPAIERVTILGCWFYNNFHDGIHITTAGGNVEGVFIQNCRFGENGARHGLAGGGFQAHAPGVYIGGGGGCMISNSFFRRNWAWKNSLSRAMLIWIAGSTAQRHVAILGNRMSVPNFIGDANYGSTEDAIIGSHNSSTDTYLSVTGNQLQFPGVADKAIKIASPFALVTDNFIRGGVGSGVALDVSGANCHVADNFVKSASVAANIPIQYSFVDTGDVTRTIVINKVHPLP